MTGALPGVAMGDASTAGKPIRAAGIQLTSAEAKLLTGIFLLNAGTILVAGRARMMARNVMVRRVFLPSWGIISHPLGIISAFLFAGIHFRLFGIGGGGGARRCHR